jgi:hypothetical protein
MRKRVVLFFGFVATLIAAPPLRADVQGSSRGGLLGAVAVLAGVIAPPAVLSLDDARLSCPAMIASSVAAYEIQGPHGDARLEQTCVVAEYRDLGRAGQATYGYGRYRVTSVFTAEEPSRGPNARDTVPEEIVVVFRSSGRATELVAVWQMRYEIGPYGILRSITPQVASATASDAVLLRVEECVNGTGGCGQDFLHFRRGAWVAVDEAWWGQLPADLRSRVLHGVQIDARTLHAEAGLYRPSDPNCCPSDLLAAQLGLVGDSLVLQSHRVQLQPQ